MNPKGDVLLGTKFNVDATITLVTGKEGKDVSLSIPVSGMSRDALAAAIDAGTVTLALETLRPKDADAIELRGAVKMQMGDTDGMQEDFSKSIALEPSNYDRLLSVYSAMSQNGYAYL